MNPVEEFEARKQAAIKAMSADEEMHSLTRRWFAASCRHRYSYNFSWMGRPVIQFPQDLVAMQEVIWQVQPDLIIETGIAHGGSIIFYASMLELLGTTGQVVGIDIDIREHNRIAIEQHPMFKRITMIEGSSVNEDVARQVRELAIGKQNVLVVLDSNHTHAHVRRELQLYSPLVTKGSYLVIFDTVVEDMPEDSFPDRPWGKGDNPRTALQEFLSTNDRFEIDEEMSGKLLITVAPGGYLRCTKD